MGLDKERQRREKRPRDTTNRIIYMQTRKTRLLDRQGSVTKFKARWFGKRPSQKEVSTSSKYKPRSSRRPPSGRSSRSPRMRTSNSGRSTSRRPSSWPSVSRWSTWTSPRDLGPAAARKPSKDHSSKPSTSPSPRAARRPQDPQTLSINQLSYRNGLRPGRQPKRNQDDPERHPLGTDKQSTHIGITYEYGRELLQGKILAPSYFLTDNMTADMVPRRRALPCRYSGEQMISSGIWGKTRD
jgi:hypothetical protein